MMKVTEQLVSIVIPVFNGERFIASAVESVFRQTYTCWELTVVDDGSTDGTPGLCDSLGAGDSRVSVIHQPNGGVNAARAKGIENSSGKYIMFLDADDELLPDAIDCFLSAIEPEDKIIVVGGRPCSMSREKYLESLLKGEIGPELWGKLFDLDMFKRMDYHLERRIAMGEDLLLNLMFALNVPDVKVVASHVYSSGTGNEESVTRTFKKTWEYEKYYFSRLEKLFLDKCWNLPNYDEIVFLVNMSRLNGMKYVMLDGNSLDYRDQEFTRIKDYFKDKLEDIGKSERLIFHIRCSALYRCILKTGLKVKDLLH